jgi:hypothetical protein
MAPVGCLLRCEAWVYEIAGPAKAGGFAEIDEVIDGSELLGEQGAASVSAYDAAVGAGGALRCGVQHSSSARLWSAPLWRTRSPHAPTTCRA